MNKSVLVQHTTFQHLNLIFLSRVTSIYSDPTVTWIIFPSMIFLCALLREIVNYLISTLIVLCFCDVLCDLFWIFREQSQDLLPHTPLLEGIAVD